MFFVEIRNLDSILCHMSANDNISPIIKFVKTHPDAVLPKSNDEDSQTGDSGYDMTAVSDKVIPARAYAIVPVGLTLAHVDPGFWFRIEPRSGLGFKHSIQPHLGVIDNGYRGDLGVKLYNFSNKDHHVQAGDRIAQLVVYRLLKPVMEWADEIKNTKRGSGGFGSTGN